MGISGGKVHTKAKQAHLTSCFKVERQNEQSSVSSDYANEPLCSSESVNVNEESITDVQPEMPVSSSENIIHEETEIHPDRRTVSSCTSQRTGKRKFKEDWCKDFTWIAFSHKTGIANCKVCASFPKLLDTNSKVVKGL